MNDELRQAAEDVCREARRIDHPTPAIVIPTGVLLSAAAVACAWRAEHPADDGQPVTPEFMESLGIGDSLPSLHGKRYELFGDGLRVLFYPCAGPLCWEPYLMVGGKSLKNPTRGQVRRLTAALTLPERNKK